MALNGAIPHAHSQGYIPPDPKVIPPPQQPVVPDPLTPSHSSPASYPPPIYPSVNSSQSTNDHQPSPSPLKSCAVARNMGPIFTEDYRRQQGMPKSSSSRELKKKCEIDEARKVRLFVWTKVRALVVATEKYLCSNRSNGQNDEVCQVYVHVAKAWPYVVLDVPLLKNIDLIAHDDDSGTGISVKVFDKSMYRFRRTVTDTGCWTRHFMNGQIKIPVGEASPPQLILSAFNVTSHLGLEEVLSADERRSPDPHFAKALSVERASVRDEANKTMLANAPAPRAHLSHRSRFPMQNPSKTAALTPTTPCLTIPHDDDDATPRPRPPKRRFSALQRTPSRSPPSKGGFASHPSPQLPSEDDVLSDKEEDIFRDRSPLQDSDQSEDQDVLDNHSPSQDLGPSEQDVLSSQQHEEDQEDVFGDRSPSQHSEDDDIVDISSSPLPSPRRQYTPDVMMDPIGTLDDPIILSSTESTPVPPPARTRKSLGKDRVMQEPSGASEAAIVKAPSRFHTEQPNPVMSCKSEGGQAAAEGLLVSPILCTSQCVRLIAVWLQKWPSGYTVPEIVDCFQLVDDTRQGPIKGRPTVAAVFQQCFPGHAWPSTTWYEAKNRWQSAEEDIKQFCLENDTRWSEFQAMVRAPDAELRNAKKRTIRQFQKQRLMSVPGKYAACCNGCSYLRCTRHISSMAVCCQRRFCESTLSLSFPSLFLTNPRFLTTPPLFPLPLPFSSPFPFPLPLSLSLARSRSFSFSFSFSCTFSFAFTFSFSQASVALSLLSYSVASVPFSLSSRFTS